MTLTQDQAKKTATYCHSFQNNDMGYLDKDGFVHLFRDGVELTAGIKAIGCCSYDNGSWDYDDENGNVHKPTIKKLVKF